MEQPIVDTTTVSEIKEGMWCEATNACTEEKSEGVIGVTESSGFSFGDNLLTYRDGSFRDMWKDIRVWEHKPEPEYPTKPGFYLFGGTIFALTRDLSKPSRTANVWHAIYGVHTGRVCISEVSCYTDNDLRRSYHDVTPIPYKLVKADSDDDK